MNAISVAVAIILALGATVLFPVTKHQSIKVGYSAGLYNRIGGNYQNVSVAWQYGWMWLDS